MYYDNDYNEAKTVLTRRLNFIEYYYDHMLKVHTENERIVGAVTAVIEANYYVEAFLFERKTLKDELYKLLPAPILKGAEVLGVSWFYMELTWRDTNTTWYFKHPYPISHRRQYYSLSFINMTSN